jgi:hypothetical protein
MLLTFVGVIGLAVRNDGEKAEGNESTRCAFLSFLLLFSGVTESLPRELEAQQKSLHAPRFTYVSR